jgi:hypothetical protein
MYSPAPRSRVRALMEDSYPTGEPASSARDDSPLPMGSA